MCTNILHAIDVAETGGAETVFIQLIENLDRTKYTPIVILPSKGWIYDQLKKLGINPFIIDMEGTFNFQYLKSVIRIIRENNVKLIQSHLLGSNIYCSIAGLITRTPVISTFHGAIDIADNESYLFIKSILLKLGSKKIVFVSNYLKNILSRRLNLPGNKSAVIYNGVNAKKYQKQLTCNFRRKLNIKEDDCFVSLIGNVNHAKGYDILIKAAAELNNKNFIFIVAGDTSDPIFSHLQKLAQENHVEDTVQFIGFIDDISDFIKSSDIYLLCSRDEGFSISTLEAMASNVPVIATKSGGPEEIISHNQNGVLVKNQSPSEIAKSLLQLSADKAFRTKLTDNATDLIEKKFSLTKTVNDYETLYSNLLNN